MKWIKGNWPTTVPEGGRRRFIVAFRSPVSDIHPKLLTTRTFELVYLNRYLMPAADGWNPPDDLEYDEAAEEYIWSGWHEDHCEHCEVTWTFPHPEMIIAHMPTPKYEER